MGWYTNTSPRDKLKDKLHIARLRLQLAKGERSRRAVLEEIDRLNYAIARLDNANRLSHCD